MHLMILSLALGIWVLYWFWSHKIHPSVEENVLNRRIKRLTNLVFGGITLYGAWEVHLACRDLWLSDQNMTYPVAFWQTLSLNHFAVFYFCIFWIRGNTLRTTRRATSQHTESKTTLLPTTSLSQCDSSAQQLSRPWSILSNMRDWSRVIYKILAPCGLIIAPMYYFTYHVFQGSTIFPGEDEVDTCARPALMIGLIFEILACIFSFITFLISMCFVCRAIIQWKTARR